MNLQTYRDQPDRLLVEIALTGAAYGLAAPVKSICNYLLGKERLQAPALIALGLSELALRHYEVASKVFDQVLIEERWAEFHLDAKAFKELIVALATHNTETNPRA